MVFPIQVGERIGVVYEIRSVITEEAGACVLDAEDLLLHRRVAIKVVDAEHTTAMMREAQVLAAVRHRCVPAVYGLGTHRGFGYIALEKLEGKSVAHALAERARAPDWFHIGEIVPLLSALADAIAALHATGRKHGNLCAENVLVCSDDRVVLRGFGGDRDDMHAFGAIAYELLTGSPPGDDTDPAAIRPDTPYPLADLVIQCLGDAPPSIERVVAELHALPRKRRRRAG